ncbi:MAG: hypothetical protein QOG23_2249 [Blastocatellia bacterium]|jgi:hypothetical protein|nr:hypothetical protein [Blastocatellia bacterium]
MSTPKDSHDLSIALFPSIERRAHPKIDHYFDALIHIVKRTNDLADESKGLTVRLVILALLIIHCIAVIKWAS